MIKLIKIPRGYSLDNIILAGLRGIIPNPHTATRVLESSPDIDNDTHTLYTVASGKILFIASCWVAIRNDSGTHAGGILRWVNAELVSQREILSPYCRASGHESLSLTFSPAIEIPATHKIFIISGIASCYIKGGISGWIEDA